MSRSTPDTRGHHSKPSTLARQHAPAHNHPHHNQTATVDKAASVPAMSDERGPQAAEPSRTPILHGGLGLLVIAILSLVILLGWRDGGRATD